MCIFRQSLETVRYCLKKMLERGNRSSNVIATDFASEKIPFRLKSGEQFFPRPEYRSGIHPPSLNMLLVIFSGSMMFHSSSFTMPWMIIFSASSIACVDFNPFSRRKSVSINMLLTRSSIDDRMPK